MTKPLIVADTGPLIALAITGLLPKLHLLFSAVYVPDAVVDEALADLSNQAGKPYTKAL
ncbi:MAG: hypothetical protein IPM37_15540 [Hahellaceae bacterium]|nr:hypothetical protein [Hahellaceae bacterium]